jgi:UDP-glucuronate decarboxylase
MNILITGGAGFLGSHLCDKLIARGDQVICVDNFFTGNKYNIQHLLGHPRFEVIRHDIVQPLYLEVDQIYNLACPASPIHYQFNAIKTIKTSTIGVVNMLGLAKRTGARILQASTSEVYGDPDVHPQPESYVGHVNTLGPRACYSADTEALTRSGWKLIKDICLTDEVLTINDKQEIVYEFPTNLIEENYVGEMVAFENKRCDFLITPNHKMLVQSVNEARKQSGTFQFVEASGMIPGGWCRAWMLRAAQNIASDQEWYRFQKDYKVMRNAKKAFVEKILMDDWLEFLGYYLSEGCCYHTKRGDYTIQISQYKEVNPEKWAKIRKCLERLPFGYCLNRNVGFIVSSKQLFHHLKPLGKSRVKYIPRDVLECSSRQLKILYDALMLGDGTIYTEKRGQRRVELYSTSSYRLAGDFQELLLKIGYVGNVRRHSPGRELYDIHVYNVPGRIKHYNKSAYSIPKKVPYDGKVYCITIPSHILFVRRNGKAAFCGNCYDEGKRVAETLFMDYHRQNNVDIRIARLFNVYGPRLNSQDGRVVSNFIVQALQNQPITIYGDGSQTRSFCYVDDLLEGLVKLMESDYTSPVNLGNPEEFSIKELAELVIQLTQSKSTITYRDLPQDDPRQRKPDITLAQMLLGWSPTKKLVDGLEPTIRYFRRIV